MNIYQSIKNFGEKALLVGGLVAFLSCCDTSPICKIQGTVKSEQRGEGWYQVSLVKHNMETLFRYNKELKIRFYSNNFDLNKIDEKINSGNKLTLIGTDVLNADLGYAFKADVIDKIE